jgi:soluble lytic murein transglycosylase
MALMIATPVVAQNEAAPPPAVTSSPVFSPFRSYGSIGDAVSTWENLRSARGMPFASLSGFLIAHPGWPGEADLRVQAEAALQPEAESPSQVISYFQRFPAISATAQLRYAEALYNKGQRDLANNAARIAWTGGAMSTDDESRFLIRFNQILTPDDHDARMNRLLWNRAVAAAQRQLPNTSVVRQPLFAARAALLAKAPDAETKATPYLDSARADAGFVADRASYLANTNQSYAVRAWLARPHSFAQPPLDAETWLKLLLNISRRAADEGDYTNAFNIARQLQDTYPAGTNVREKPLSERDPYTSLVWLAADTALNKLGKYRDAVPLFAQYAASAKTSFSQSKGLYWAGRAADAAGDRALAIDYYQRASAYFENFHGQLADERLGRMPALGTAPAVVVPPQARDAYLNSELARAAIYLGQNGNHAEQTLFMRAIAASAKGDFDLALASELGSKMGRTDMGVWASRITRGSGGADFIRAGFPRISVEAMHAASWTIIHAIARQETNFDVAAVSRTNARGLMQLEPYTAKPLAIKNGMPYDYDRLTTDPAYNMGLGAHYFGELMTRFNGCYVCSAGAYNAGPGRINQWIARNGDPRSPSVDVVKWIEAIPITETRGYVQNVLQNAVVYDLLNPQGPTVRSRTPLSTYLGR